MLHKNTLCLLALSLCFLFNSCATVLNSSNSQISIKTSERAHLIYEMDTLLNNSDEPFTGVFPNSRQPLMLTFFNENRQKTLLVHSFRAKEYYLNLMSPYLLGFLVDELNTKKWDYPRNIYVDMFTGSYLPYHPMDTTKITGRKSRFAITPLSSVIEYHPGIEISAQRLISTKFALQGTYKHMLPANNDWSRNATGFSATLEFKHYYRNTVNSRFYLSLGYEYLHKNHNAPIRYTDANYDPSSLEEPVSIWILADIQKRFHSVTPRFGIEYYLSDRVVIDGYFGVGLRYRKVSHGNAPLGFVQGDYSSDLFDVSYGSNMATSAEAVPNLDLNFRIAWVF